MSGIVSAHIPWNGISNLELQWLYNALHGDLVLSTAMTISNLCQREYALSMDAIKKHLLA
jgi:hypothetical protein